MKKRLGCLSFFLIALLGGGYWAIENVLSYSIIKPWKHAAKSTPAELGLAAEHLAIDGFDGVKINGWFVRPAGDSIYPNTAIFCHGIGGNLGHFIKTAQFVSENGWNSVLLDGRAQGESGGDFCTFGYFEEKDLQLVVDFLKKNRPVESQKLGIWGASLGGAIALQCLENDPRLDFGIVESTFTDLPTIVSDYQAQKFFNIRLPWASEKALKKAGELAHFDPTSVRPVDAAKQIFQPILMAHGDADDRISVDYGRRIFQNLASKNKELVIVPGANHINVHTVGGADFDKKCLQFLDSQRFVPMPK